MTRKAVIVGSSGQDGRLLTGLLAGRGYDVTGITRAGVVGPGGITPLDITDFEQVAALVRGRRPDEIYFLAARHASSENLDSQDAGLFSESIRIHLAGAATFLEALRRELPQCRFFYAASSHVFGLPVAPIQDEDTPLRPDSVYGITKAAGLLAVRYYRETHELFASGGILYNHESSFRDARFVSKKIACGAARIKRGLLDRIVLGNLDAAADWGYAPDFVEAMRRMLALEHAGDYIVATGERHTVREFAQTAFDYVGLDYDRYVDAAPELLKRRTAALIGNPARLKAATGWAPTVSFQEMVRLLVQTELDAIDAK